eukprot:TRINITY_DN1166_c0_g1_i1.p1 TRINITY_DN1166_c0_g1~~TRINITY_DN1166_c0_g1_i1.p1  ORF type:complete len:113 (-),score=13.05 TRINITY_DN1166_c0_g1_i1:2-340(-)
MYFIFLVLPNHTCYLHAIDLFHRPILLAGGAKALIVTLSFMTCTRTGSSLRRYSASRFESSEIFTDGSFVIYGSSSGSSEPLTYKQMHNSLSPHVLCVDTGRSSETAKAHRG